MRPSSNCANNEHLAKVARALLCSRFAGHRRVDFVLLREVAQARYEVVDFDAERGHILAEGGEPPIA